MPSAQQLHQQAVIVNGLDAAPFNHKLVENMKKGGLNCNVVYAGVDLETTEERRRVLNAESDSLVLATTAREIREAKEKGKIAIVFNWQHVNPIGNDVDMLGMYYALGLRICGLCYNVRNLVGDGCTERTECGLSLFGERVVRKIQGLRMVLDIGGHTSEATSRDVLDMTKGAVVCTHTNCRALRNNPRCMTDDMMRAIARRGGVIGLTCYGYFLTDGRATLETYLDHVDHAVRTAGVEHVGIGLDQIEYPAAQSNTAELALPSFQDPLAAPRPRAYPLDSSQWYTEGLETIAQMPNITEGLVRRGYGAANVRQIMGENWLRVYQEIWGD
jgi:membrane dipeptidase